MLQSLRNILTKLLVVQFVLSIVAQPILGSSLSIPHVNGEDVFVVISEGSDQEDDRQMHFELTSNAVHHQMKHRLAKWLYGALEQLNIVPRSREVSEAVPSLAMHLVGRVETIIFPFHSFW